MLKFCESGIILDSLEFVDFFTHDVEEVGVHFGFFDVGGAKVNIWGVGEIALFG